MKRLETATLIGLAVTVIGGAVAFGNLQGRVVSIENTIKGPLEVIRKEAEKIKAELREITPDLRKSSVPSGTIAAFLRADCPDNWSEMDGADGSSDLRGRFLVGVGPFPQDKERELRLRDDGGSHQMRIKAYGNQADCCTDDQGIIQVNVEWKDEGEVTVVGRGDAHREVSTSDWMNHFPPYVAVRWCMKS